MTYYPTMMQRHTNRNNLKVALQKLFDNYKDLEEIIFKYGQYAVNIIEYNNRPYFLNNKDTTMLQKVTIADTCLKVFPRDYLDNVWHAYKKQLIAKARKGPKLMLILYMLYEPFFDEGLSNILIARMKGYKNIFYIDYLIKCATCFTEHQINRLKTLKLTFSLI